jgi:putative transposase
MARRARLKLAGLPLHVIQRGNNKSDCFFHERDYLLFLQLLEELGSLFECSVHTYVLMTNHVHLLVTPQRPEGVSQMMKHLGQRYVQYVNRTYKRTGCLWEGRFRSSIVDSEEYLMRCYRYIELNPVRAGIVRHPAHYAWSSYHANALGRSCSVVVPHAQYLALASSEEGRRVRYSELVDGALSSEELEEIRAAARGGYALGRRGFVSGIESLLGRHATAKPGGRPKKRR